MLQGQLLNNNWSTSIQCNTAADELDQSYDFMTQIHRDSNSATLIAGYTGFDEYDSYFILSKEDLVKLRDMIDESIKKFDFFTEQLEIDEQIRHNLSCAISDISKDPEMIEQTEIHIEYRDPIDCNPFESLFGSVHVVISINKNLLKTYTIIMTRDEFVDDVKDLLFFDGISDKLKFVIENPEKKDEINEWYRKTLGDANSAACGLPQAIAPEDLNELKNNMLSAIDAMYDKK